MNKKGSDKQKIYYAPDVFVKTEEREKYLYRGGKIPKEAKITNLRDNQILVEFDRKKKSDSIADSRKWTVPAIKKIFKSLRADQIKAYTTDHKGVSPYIRIDNIKGMKKMLHEERKQYRLNVYKKYVPAELLEFVDTSFTDEFRWTSMVGREHYKKAIDKRCKGYGIEEVVAGKANMKAENKLIKELLPKKEKVSKDVKALAVAGDDTLKSIPCYAAILNNPDADWRARGFSVLFLKNYYKFKEDKVNEFIKTNCKWSDYNESKTSKHAAKYFQKGNKAEQIKGYPTKKTLRKYGLCLDCRECFFEAANYRKDTDNQAEKIINEAEGMQLFSDQYNEPCARIEINDHFEIHPINSKFFKRWISKLYYESNGKPPNSNSLSGALKVLEAEACFNGPKKKLHNRVAFIDGVLWYDLTDKLWRAVRIDEKGWEIVTNPPIIFKRYTHQAAQVEPKEKGDYSKLKKYYNIKDAKNIQLIEVYVASCFIANIPHPIPTLHGPQGSTKTTAFKVNRHLIDPSVIEVLGAPREPKELVQMLAHHYYAPFDNLTRLQPWLSDALCKSVTGDGFSKRQLFTDDDDIIYTFRRCVGINGINVPATRPDLLDRAMLMQFERPAKDKRLTERKFWQAFEKDRASILGGMFDILSEAMRIKKELELPELPRMADFCEWGEAISRAMGYDPDSFVKNYFENVGQQNVEAIEAHIIGPCILKLLKVGNYEGTAAALLERLEGIAESLKINIKAREWPKAPHILTRRLNEIKSNLEEEGVKIEYNHSGDRTISIYSNKNKASEASEASIKTEEVIDEKDATDAKDATFSTNNLTDNDLIAFVKEKPGYDMQEFSNKYGEDRMRRILSAGEVFEKKPGKLWVLE